jgi:hypothetical protein
MDIEENIELRVLLLAIYKKQENDTFLDVIKTMENSRVFNLKTGKKYLRRLKELNYIIDDSLTLIGIQKAKEVEQEFSL